MFSCGNQTQASCTVTVPVVVSRANLCAITLMLFKAWWRRHKVLSVTLGCDGPSEVIVLQDLHGMRTHLSFSKEGHTQFLGVTGVNERHDFYVGQKKTRVP